MFEKASKLKLRFESPLGMISVEDLWDLPLTGNGACLDGIARLLNKAIKEEEEEESFVAQRSTKNITINLRFDIVKHIISARLAAADQSEKRAETKAKKEQLSALILEKENDDLKGMSAEDLKKMRDEL